MDIRQYIAIDLKSFYASVECVERELDPLTTNLVVAYRDRTEKTICLAVSPSLKACGLSGRARLFEVIQVDHSTFYNHDRRGVKVTQNQIRDEWLKVQISEIYNKSGGRFGSNKVFEKLKIQGISCSLGKVSSLFKKLGLVSKRRKRPIKKADKPKRFYYKNKLKQNFVQSCPNLFWVGDVTEVKINSAKFYICTIMDLFSRKIIAHRLSSQNNNKLTVNTFKDAFESGNRPNGLIFHSG